MVGRKRINEMNKNRPATLNEIKQLEAIEEVVTRHAEETKTIMETNGPTKMLRLALSDATTGKALYQLDAQGLSAALDLVVENEKENDEDSAERDNLKSTVDSLCDLGELDAVTQALKNCVLGAVQKNTGAKPVASNGTSLRKISVFQSRSPISFNCSKIKRSPIKSFNDSIDKPQNAAVSRVAGHLNINNTARSVLEDAMARKASDGRLNNPTQATATLKPTPIGKENDVTKFTDDEELLEGTWTSHAKKEAAGRMKSDTAAGKTIEIPVVRMASFDDIRSRLPFEFRGVNPSDAAKRLTQGVVDVVNPNGSAHGPIDFNTDGTKPAIAGQTKDSVFPNGKSTFPNKEKQWDVNLKKPKQPVQNQNPEGNPYTGAA
jgi:hypothetical protein